MLIERPLSLTATAVAVALIAPECTALLNHAGRPPRMILVVAALLGAFGVYLGTAVAGSYRSPTGRTLRLLTWGLVSIGLGVGIGICMTGGTGLLGKIGMGSAVLPPAVFLLMLIRSRREGPSSHNGIGPRK